MSSYVVGHFIEARLTEQPPGRASDALRLLIEHVNGMGNFDDDEPLFIVAEAWKDHPDWPGYYSESDHRGVTK